MPDGVLTSSGFLLCKAQMSNERCDLTENPACLVWCTNKEKSPDPHSQGKRPLARANNYAPWEKGQQKTGAHREIRFFNSWLRDWKILVSDFKRHTSWQFAPLEPFQERTTSSRNIGEIFTDPSGIQSRHGIPSTCH